MKLCDDIITIFNGRADPEAGCDVYVPTVIRGASWRAVRAGASDPKGGRVAANRVIVRIPEGADAGGRRWADPMAYRAAEDIAGLWTLGVGDVIVRGDAGDAEPSPASLRARFADCVTVQSVADNRRGAHGRHWKAEGN